MVSPKPHPDLVAVHRALTDAGAAFEAAAGMMEKATAPYEHDAKATPGCFGLVEGGSDQLDSGYKVVFEAISDELENSVKALGYAADHLVECARHYVAAEIASGGRAH